MRLPPAERREWRRFGARPDRPGQISARLFPGKTVRLLDISRGGVLVESDTRLRPGAPVQLQLGAPDAPRQLLRAQVVRCWVSALIHGGPMRYRAALAFGSPIEMDESQWVPRG